MVRERCVPWGSPKPRWRIAPSVSAFCVSIFFFCIFSVSVFLLLPFLRLSGSFASGLRQVPNGLEGRRKRRTGVLKNCVHAVEKGLLRERTKSVVKYAGQNYAKREGERFSRSPGQRRHLGLAQDSPICHAVSFITLASLLSTEEQRSGLLDVWHRLKRNFRPAWLSRPTARLDNNVFLSPSPPFFYIFLFVFFFLVNRFPFRRECCIRIRVHEYARVTRM